MSLTRALLRSALLVVVALGVTLGGTALAAPTAHRDPAFEDQITRELRAIAPDAVPIFQSATAASDAGDLASAIDQYARVLVMAPRFEHAERRECAVLAALGRRDEAMPLCRSALATDASPYNQGALAATLLSTRERTRTEDLAEAKDLATRAARAKPDDVYLWGVLGRAALASNDVPLAREATDKLLILAPDEPLTNFEAAAAVAADGDPDRAEKLLARAEKEGMPAAATAPLADAIEQSRGPWWFRAAKGLGRALVVWLGVFALLLGAGYVLSRATLRALDASPTEAHVRPSERRLRATYRAILWCACAYYYVSLPLVVVLVVTATVGLVAGIVAAGFIAPKLFIILGIIGFGSIMAIARSLFVRARDEDPGIPLDLGANPSMRAVLDEVAARIGTRPVDRVFMTPFTEVAVFDRGSLGAQLRGGRDRCLILGAGVLDGMGLRSFKSVLAHEYGHFHNEDTAGGGFALAVRRSLATMTMQLVARRVASPLNPAWWFVRGFWRAFLGVSQGASRLQEVLADRWAAFAYGSRAFEEGLRHVIERSVRFEAHVNVTLEEVVKTRAALPNLYAFAPAEPKPEGDVDKAIAAAFSREPTPFDSHPCPKDRLARVAALGFAGDPAAPDDEQEAWALFADRAAIEAQMTGEVRARLRARRGVVVAAS